MTALVSLKNGNAFECRENETILEAAMRNGTVLEYSCSNGQCNACKCKVLEGLGNVVSEDTVNSSEKDTILTCQTRILGPISLDIEDLPELAQVKTISGPCKISGINALSADIVEVTLRFPPSLDFSYLSGQYIEITKSESLRRSYSIANAKRRDGTVSLHIRRVEGGEMSAYWFGEARVDDLLHFRGPLGTFFVRQSVDSSNLVLLATGAGLAPINAILQNLESHPIENMFDRIILVWGGRYQKDFYQKLEYRIDNLEVYQCVSREDDAQQFKKGYVQDVACELGINFSNAAVYLCGSMEMINGAKAELVKRGVSEDTIYADAFVKS